jgi:C4-dicarboxylate transporter DctM subunit
MNIFAVITVVITFLLLITGMPLAIAFAFGSLIIALTVMGIPLEGIAGFAFNSINSFPLLAMPFFILAGNLLVRSGGMEHVRDFMQSWFGQVRGGLAVGAIIIAAFIGAVSGSTAAALAIMGTIVLPIMVEAGYSRPFSAAIALTGGELSWLIPPSLGFILFGALNRVSIADLFLSGIGPGLLSGVFMIIVAIFISRRRKYPPAPRVGWRARGRSFVRALPLLFMPIVVLGGIYGGIFSPTESAGVACLYTLLIGFLFYRQLNWTTIKESLIETLKIACMIYFLIVCADLFAKMISFIMLPQMITDLVNNLNLGPLSFLIVVEVFLLAVGFFFSSIAMIIVILPLFMPTVALLGIDPVFFGALTMMCVCIGEITPPMGPQLWFAEPICKVKMGDIMKETWIFLGAMTVPIFVVTFVPDIAMFLVKLFR